MKRIFLASACRTAIGSFGGSLKEVSPVELGACVARGVLERAGLAYDRVRELGDLEAVQLQEGPQAPAGVELLVEGAVWQRRSKGSEFLCCPTLCAVHARIMAS